jgi:hypothetical protein
MHICLSLISSLIMCFKYNGSWFFKLNMILFLKTFTQILQFSSSPPLRNCICYYLANIYFPMPTWYNRRYHAFPLTFSKWDANKQVWADHTNIAIGFKEPLVQLYPGNTYVLVGISSKEKLYVESWNVFKKPSHNLELLLGEKLFHKTCRFLVRCYFFTCASFQGCWYLCFELKKKNLLSYSRSNKSLCDFLLCSGDWKNGQYV